MVLALPERLDARLLDERLDGLPGLRLDARIHIAMRPSPCLRERLRRSRFPRAWQADDEHVHAQNYGDCAVLTFKTIET